MAVMGEKISASKGAVCVNVVKFVFSLAGLLLLNIAYMAIGALLFEYLEQHNEKQECWHKAGNYIRAERAALVLLDDIGSKVRRGILQDYNGHKTVHEDFNSVLHSFSQNVLEIGYNVSKNCSNLGEPGGPAYHWSTSGALTFAITVVTTIGYGHIAPRTYWGKWVCIAYALVGIPLMISFLTKLGSIMANMFRYIYGTVCCCGCCRKKPKPGEPEELEENALAEDSPHSATPSVMRERLDLSEEDLMEYDYTEDITVPLTVTMIVIITFIILGASLFVFFENWSFIDSCYFCFVTFTTIGFGDMVPGTTNLDSMNSKIQLAVTGIYQFFAIAMLSMCLQMMVDELELKFKWLAEKIGLFKKDSTASLESPIDDNVVDQAETASAK